MSIADLAAIVRDLASRTVRLGCTCLLVAAAGTVTAQSGTTGSGTNSGADTGANTGAGGVNSGGSSGARGAAVSGANSGNIGGNIGGASGGDQAGHADPQAGSRIAANGAPGGAAACMGCHGANGEGNAAAGFPALVGQSAVYLERQMHSFANGARTNPVMTPIAKALNAQQQRDVSAWYATVPVAAAVPAGKTGGSAGAGGAKAGAGGAGAGGPAGNARQIEQGRVLATQGDSQRRVQACANCHGPGGVGEAPGYPALAGQPATYFTAAMDEWKSGTRKTDPSGQMPTIAKQLAAEQIGALAAYFASLPRSGFAQAANIPAGSSLRPAVAASATGSGPPAQASAGAQGDGGRRADGGVPAAGTEQGAPITGGNQGPGGGGGTKSGNPSQPGTATAPPAPQSPPGRSPSQPQEEKK